MLRTAVLLLLAANIVFFAWARGGFAPSWPPPRHGEREPQRIAAQIRPEAVRLLAPAAASAAVAAAGSAPSAAASSCIEAGPYDARGLVDAADVLAAAGLSEGRWQRVAAASGPSRTWLRIDAVDAALQSQLARQPGVGLRPCETR